MSVGSYPPNKFGLRDAHGNVWEWTDDCWNKNYIGAPSDTSAWRTGDCRLRVLRGGSWFGFSHYVRSAVRYADSIETRSNGIGFRIVRTLPFDGN